MGIIQETVRYLRQNGKVHENQKEYDALRTFIINQLGINVIRFKNEELANVKLVCDRIKGCFEI